MDCPDNLEILWTIQKLSGQSTNCPDNPQTVQTNHKLSEISQKITFCYFTHICREFVNIAVLDKSLDLEKFSKRNYSWFSLSSWRNEFSCLVLLSIFKILRNYFSFPSWFTRFLSWTSLSPLDFQDFVKQFPFLLSIFEICRTISLPPLDFQDFVEHFLFLILNERWNPLAKTSGCWWLFVVWSHPRSPCGLPADDNPHRPESH